MCQKQVQQDGKNYSYPSLFLDKSNTDAFEQVCDVFIAWTLRCAMQNTEDKMKLYAKRLLGLFIFNEYDIQKLDGYSFSCVETYRQENVGGKRRIDIRVVAHVSGIGKYQIIIENKYNDVIDEEQLRVYEENVPRKFQSDITKYVAIQTGSCADKQGHEICKKHKFEYYDIWDAKEKLFCDGETGNIIFDEFWFRWLDEEPQLHQKS